MTTFSTFPVVKAAVVQLITAALPTVQVSYGPPGVGQTKREVVVVGDSVDWNESWVVLGRGKVEDSYSIQIRIGVAAEAATTFQTTEERAFAIADGVASAVRGVSTIAGMDLPMPLSLVRSQGFLTSDFSDDQGSARITWLEFAIAVQARI